MGACLADQVDADGVDDELGPLQGGCAVALVGGGAVGDDVTFVQLPVFVAGVTLGVSTQENAGDAAAGPQVELDTPFAVAFAELEAAAVDLPAPLFRYQATMATYDNPALLN